MKSAKQIGCEVETWIVEEDLPVWSPLKVIRKRDPDYGLTEQEIQDRNESIRCYLMREFELLTMIPEQDEQSGFFIGDYGVEDAEYSAFSTMDFQRQMRPFNKYGYALKLIMGQVRDLAIFHSSISHEEGRLDTQRRYEALVYREFRDELLIFARRYKSAEDAGKRRWLKQKIGKLNRRILECKKIWERFAPPENWEP